MLTTPAYAAFAHDKPLGPHTIERREPGAHDVLVHIDYCGVCHSDLHQVRDEWQNSTFPIVPGHEIVGKVAKVGSGVTKYKVGDTVGVGCMVDSCRTCTSCKEGLEQYCVPGFVGTYNGVEKDGKTRTYGGYSTQITVDEAFVLRVDPKQKLDAVAPLLCAGITTYSPLVHWKTGKGTKVGVVGLGGLGHMAVKIAAAMGAEVTLFSSSEKKRSDAKRLGAHEYVVTSDAAQMSKHAERLDLVIDTVSAKHDLAGIIGCTHREGTVVLVGAPDEPLPFHPFPLIMRRRSVAGSLIGGIKETQEMLDFCAAHNIVSDVETIPVQQIDAAYDRMLKGDVRYRFVVDANSLRQ